MLLKLFSNFLHFAHAVGDFHHNAIGANRFNLKLVDIFFICEPNTTTKHTASTRMYVSLITGVPFLLAHQANRAQPFGVPRCLHRPQLPIRVLLLPKPQNYLSAHRP